jgi:hypothetical protein
MDEQDPMEGCEEIDFPTRLALEFDPRLADVWTAIFSLELEPDDLRANLGALLRMAYLRGYQDALSEAEPGPLFRRLGMPAPTVARGRPRPPRKGGRR